MKFETPEHLKNCTVFLKKKNGSVSFKCRCECGGEAFRVYRDSLTGEQKAEIDELDRQISKRVGWKSVYGETDKDGRPKMYVKYLFGLIKKEIRLPEYPVYVHIHAAKIKCVECGRKYELFDNRYHGYDAVNDSPSAEAQQYQVVYQESKHMGMVEILLSYSENAEKAEEFDWIN